MSLTQEKHQFESISVTTGSNEHTFHARVFTIEEEPDFAGHPLIGLAAHLHEEYGSDESHNRHIQLNKQKVVLKTQKTESYFQATMDQGAILKILQQEVLQGHVPHFFTSTSWLRATFHLKYHKADF